MLAKKVSSPLPTGRKSSHYVKLLLEARNFNLMGYYQYSRQYTNSLVKYVGDRCPLIARGAGAFVRGISGHSQLNKSICLHYYLLVLVFILASRYAGLLPVQAEVFRQAPQLSRVISL